jgi:hypothetical protein
MKNCTMKKINAFLVLMLIFCAQNFRSQNVLQPENVFNLYFDAFIKHNDESLKELNSYLINFLGKDHTFKMSLDESHNGKINYYTEVFLSNLSPEVAEACKTEAKKYFTVLMENFKDANYKIKSIKTVPLKESKDQEISEVTFDVNFKVPSSTSEIQMNDIKKAGAKEIKKYLEDITIYFKKADKMVTAEQKFNLYQVKSGRDIYYWNGGPQELIWKLNEFYLKNIN